MYYLQLFREMIQIGDTERNGLFLIFHKLQIRIFDQPLQLGVVLKFDVLRCLQERL